MALKNYTTSIAPMKTIGEIQGILVAHGAKAIMIDYGEDREPTSLTFIIPTEQGDIPFRLPVKIDAVALILSKMGDPGYRQYDRRYQEERAAKIKKQAARVGWRILKDWVDAQCAIIETNMVTLTQVFLPYMQVKGVKTLYEVMLDKGFYLEEGRD